MTRDGSQQTPVWTPTNAGGLVHTPAAMNWGPGRACPTQVVVVPADDQLDPPWGRRPSVTLSLVDPNGSVGAVNMNPGAARWLGNRLIDAAAFAENPVIAEAVAERAAALAPEQDDTQ